jgi:DNA-binding GntR family transcriptional regulator
MIKPASRKTAAVTEAKPRGRPKLRPTRIALPQSRVDENAGETEDRIYDAVVQSVLRQRLKPGTKLPEAALCELFGVGRSMVQKVLQRLAHNHVVELRPNRGAMVAVPTLEEVSKLFEARRALEAAIVPLVTKAATAADYTMLRRHLRREHRAMHHENQAEWAALASAFHTTLGTLSGNPLLQRYLDEVVSRCAMVVAIFQPPGNATCEHGEHERVVDLMERGDAAAAVREMNKHLLDLEAHINIMQSGPSSSLAAMLGLE